MIATLTLNPCIDRTVRVSRLCPGETLRARDEREDVGGKGVNVSVALSNLGVRTRCLALAHARGGERLQARLAGTAAAFTGIPAPGALRVNLKIYDEAAREMTEINALGAPCGEETCARVLAAADALPADTRALALCGSLPPGLPDTLYATLIARCAARGIRCALDASGAALLAGVQAAPWLVKPNRRELEQLAGEAVDGLPAALRACRDVLARGVEEVCLSLGGEGALLVTRAGAWFSPTLPVPVRGVQGAGDSLLAGLLLAMDAAPAERLRTAAAVAQGSVQREGTLLCTKAQFEALLPCVRAQAVAP